MEALWQVQTISILEKPYINEASNKQKVINLAYREVQLAKTNAPRIRANSQHRQTS